MPTTNVIAALRQVWDASKDPIWPSVSEVELTATEVIPFGRFDELALGGIYVTLHNSQAQVALNAKQPGSLRAGDRFTFTLPRQMDRLVVAESLASILQIRAAQTRLPAAYILLQSESNGGFFSYTAESKIEQAPVVFQRYHAAIRLWTMLADIAEYTDETNGDLLFFGTRRTILKPGFNLADLGGPIAVELFDKFFQDDDRKDARSEIFVCVLSEYLRDQDGDSAFRSVLRGTEVLARRLREGFAIYLAQHSPEKVAEAAKAASLTLSEKLEKIISSLETKSLSIPIALLLGVKDVESGLGATALNSVFIISGLIFAATMCLVHFSQLALLDVIRSMIESSEAEFKLKGLSENNEVLVVAFGSLKKRSKAAKGFSWLMAAASWVPLASIVGTVFLGVPKPTPALVPAQASAVVAPVAAPASTKSATASSVGTGTGVVVPTSKTQPASTP